MKSKKRVHNGKNTSKKLFIKKRGQKGEKTKHKNKFTKKPKTIKKNKKIMRQTAGNIDAFGYNIPKITTSLISEYMIAIAKDNQIKDLSFDIEPKYELYNFENKEQLWQFLTSLSQEKEFKDTILWHIVNSKSKNKEPKPFNYPDFPGIIKIILSIAMSPSLLLAYYLDDIEVDKTISRHSIEILDKLNQINSPIINKTLINAIRMLFLNDDLININEKHVKKPTENIDKYWIALTIILLFVQELILKKQNIIDTLGYLDEIVKIYNIIKENLPVTFVLLEQIALKQTTIHGLYRHHKHQVKISDDIPLVERINVLPVYTPQTTKNAVVEQIMKQLKLGHIHKAIELFDHTIGIENATVLTDMYKKLNKYHKIGVGAHNVSINEILQSEIQLNRPTSEHFNNNIGINNYHQIEFGSEDVELEQKGISNITSKRNNNQSSYTYKPQTELELDYMSVLQQFENDFEPEENNTNVIKPFGIRHKNTVWDTPTTGYVPSVGKPRRQLHRSTLSGGNPLTRTISSNSFESAIINTTPTIKPKKQNRRDEMVNMTQYKNVLAYLFPDSYQPNIGKDNYNILLPPAVLLILSIKLNHEGLTKQDNIFLNGKFVPELFGCAPTKTECKPSKTVKNILELIKQIEQKEIIRKHIHDKSITMGIKPEYTEQLFNVVQSAKIQGTLSSMKLKLQKLYDELSGNEVHSTTGNGKINDSSFYKLLNNIIPTNVRHCKVQQSGGGLLYPMIAMTPSITKGFGSIGRRTIKLVSKTGSLISKKAGDVKIYAGEIALGVRDINSKICKNERITFNDLNPLVNRLHWRITKNILNVQTYVSTKAKKHNINIGDEYFIRNTFSPVLFKFPIEVGFIGKLFIRQFKNGENIRHKKYMEMIYNIRFLQFICYTTGIYSENFIKTAIFQLFGEKGKYRKGEEEFFTIIESINMNTLINNIKHAQQNKPSTNNNTNNEINPVSRTNSVSSIRKYSTRTTNNQGSKKNGPITAFI